MWGQNLCRFLSSKIDLLNTYRYIDAYRNEESRNENNEFLFNEARSMDYAFTCRISNTNISMNDYFNASQNCYFFS